MSNPFEDILREQGLVMPGAPIEQKPEPVPELLMPTFKGVSEPDTSAATMFEEVISNIDVRDLEGPVDLTWKQRLISLGANTKQAAGALISSPEGLSGELMMQIRAMPDRMRNADEPYLADYIQDAINFSDRMMNPIADAWAKIKSSPKRDRILHMWPALYTNMNMIEAAALDTEEEQKEFMRNPPATTMYPLTEEEEQALQAINQKVISSDSLMNFIDAPNAQSRNIMLAALMKIHPAAAIISVVGMAQWEQQDIANRLMNIKDAEGNEIIPWKIQQRHIANYTLSSTTVEYIQNVTRLIPLSNWRERALKRLGQKLITRITLEGGAAALRAIAEGGEEAVQAALQWWDVTQAIEETEALTGQDLSKHKPSVQNLIADAAGGFKMALYTAGSTEAVGAVGTQLQTKKAQKEYLQQKGIQLEELKKQGIPIREMYEFSLKTDLEKEVAQRKNLEKESGEQLLKRARDLESQHITRNLDALLEGKNDKTQKELLIDTIIAWDKNLNTERIEDKLATIDKSEFDNWTKLLLSLSATSNLNVEDALKFRAVMEGIYDSQMKIQGQAPLSFNDWLEQQVITVKPGETKLSLFQLDEGVIQRVKNFIYRNADTERDYADMKNLLDPESLRIMSDSRLSALLGQMGEKAHDELLPDFLEERTNLRIDHNFPNGGRQGVLLQVGPLQNNDLVYIGEQETGNGDETISMFNLKRDIEGHLMGSTISQDTAEAAGLVVPTVGPALNQASAKHGGNVGEDGMPFSFFDLSFEKTGEGAHAFGWGVYLTQKDGIAKGYAKNIKEKQSDFYVVDEKGKKLPVQPFKFSAPPQITTHNPGDMMERYTVHLPGRADVNLTVEDSNLYDSATDLYSSMKKEALKLIGFSSSATIEEIHARLTAELTKVSSPSLLGNAPEAISILYYTHAVGMIEDMMKAGVKFEQKGAAIYDVTIFPGMESHEYNLLSWWDEAPKDLIDLAVKADPVKLKQLGIGFHIGKDVYLSLANLLGSKKAASLYLLENGIDGIVYPIESLNPKNRNKSLVEGDQNFVIFDEKQIRIEAAQLLQRGRQMENSQVIKGLTQFYDIEDTIRAYIHFFETGDTSTLVHEFGHLVTTLLDDKQLDLLAQRVAAEEGISWAVLKGQLKLFRANPTDQRLLNAKGEYQESLVTGLEYFARQFESYFSDTDPKAPPIRELRPVFKSIGQQLKNIYKNMSQEDTIVGKLDPQMSAMFDELIAGEDLLPEGDKTKTFKIDGHTYRPYFSRPQIKAHRTLLKAIENALADIAGLKDALRVYADNILGEGSKARKNPAIELAISKVSTHKEAYPVMDTIHKMFTRQQKAAQEKLIDQLKTLLSKVEWKYLDAKTANKLKAELEDIDFSNLSPRKLSSLSSLREAINKQLGGTTPGNVMGLSREQLQELENLSNRNVYDMSLEDLHTLYDSLSAIIQLDTLKKQYQAKQMFSFLKKRYQECSDAAAHLPPKKIYMEGARSTNLQGRKITKLLHYLIVTDTRLPENLLEYLADFDENSPILQLHKDMSDGGAYTRRVEQDYYNFCQSLIDDYDISKWSRHTHQSGSRGVFPNFEMVRVRRKFIDPTTGHVKYTNITVPITNAELQGFRGRKGTDGTYSVSIRTTTFDKKTNERIQELEKKAKVAPFMTVEDQKVWDKEAVELDKLRTRQMGDYIDISEDEFRALMQPERLTSDYVYIKVHGIDGDVFMPITRAERLSIYLYSMNENATRHLVGEQQDDGTWTGGLKFTDNSTWTYNITRQQLGMIVSELSLEEKAVADRIMKYYTGNLKPAINRVSQAMDGKDIATEDNYFPILAAVLEGSLSEILNMDSTSQTHKAFYRKLIERQSFLLSRTKSNSPMWIMDAFEIMSTNISGAARYMGYAAPIRAAKIVIFNGADDSNSFRNRVSRSWGPETLGALEKWVERIEDPFYLKDDNWPKIVRYLSNAQTMTLLSWNVGTALFQRPSVNLALNYGISLKNLEKAKLSHPLGGKYSIDDLMELHPDFFERYLKGFNMALSETHTQSKTRMNFAKHESVFHDIRNMRDFHDVRDVLNRGLREEGMMWIYKNDAWALSTIWDACQMQIKEDQPNLSEEQSHDKALELMRLIVRKTQPDYLMENLNLIQSSKDIATRIMIGKFGNQKQKLVNEVERSARLMAKGLKKGNGLTIRERLKLEYTGVMNMWRSTFMINFYIAAIRAALKEIGGGDDEKKEPLIARLMLDTIQNIIATYPLVGPLLAITMAKARGLRVFDFTNIVQDGLSAAASSTGGAINNMTDGDLEKGAINGYKSLEIALGIFGGYPLYQLRKDIGYLLNILGLQDKREQQNIRRTEQIERRNNIQRRDNSRRRR